MKTLNAIAWLTVGVLAGFTAFLKYDRYEPPVDPDKVRLRAITTVAVNSRSTISIVAVGPDRLCYVLTNIYSNPVAISCTRIES